MEITERQRAILCQIIEEYAETASPVGSVTLAKLFGVSSATVRAEMARLEALGLIAQPHTSAGRVPTDAGYRLYVNNIDGILKENWGRRDKTDSGSENSDSERSSDDGRLDGSRLDDGNRSNNGDRPKNVHRADENNWLMRWGMLGDENNNRSIRRGVHAIEVRISSQSRADTAIRGAVDALVELTGNLGLATIGDQLYLAGMSRLFTQPEFLDSRRVQAVAKLLDNLEPWLREAAPGEPLNIFIGHENPIGKNSDVSLIISRFRSPFSDRSYIGTLGPTRQNYFKIMSLVRYAGDMLEEVL